MKKTCSVFVLSFLIILWSVGPAGTRDDTQDQIEKAKIFRDSYPLISETDLYCSFFILDELPTLKIVAVENREEKQILSDGDFFYANKGKSEGLKEGLVLTVLEVDPKITFSFSKKGYGLLAFRRGRARIISLESNLALAKVEKACGPVRVGDLLIPFEEKSWITGKDLGFNVPAQGGEVLTGTIIFLENELNQIGNNQWALIDLGLEQGIRLGQQLTVFNRAQNNLSLQAVGNVVVIEAGIRTSTVKVLSSRDVIKLGDVVQIK